MSEWSDLAQSLVGLDFAIEELESWATRDEDVQLLRRLEELRDEIQEALARHRLTAHLRRSLREREGSPELCHATTEPRD